MIGSDGGLPLRRDIIRLAAARQPRPLLTDGIETPSAPLQVGFIVGAKPAVLANERRQTASAHFAFFGETFRLDRLSIRHIHRSTSAQVCDHQYTSSRMAQQRG